MGVRDNVKGNSSTCPCCSKLQKYEGFQQLIELKSSGVIIYLHRINEPETSGAEVVKTTSEDVYILHNVKNDNILTADVLAQLDKNKIYCPRCRKIYEHAQKLFQETTADDKRDVVGICDHCRLKARLQEPCNKCDEVIRKFLKAYNAQRDSPTKNIKTWLAKIGDVINKTQQKVKSMKSVRRAKSEVDFDQLSHQRLSKSVRDLKTELLFHSRTTLSDTDIAIAKKYSKNQVLKIQKDNKVDESLEPIYIFPRFISSSSKTDLFHDLKTNKAAHIDKDDELGKKQETRTYHVFKEKYKTEMATLLNAENKLYTIQKDSRLSTNKLDTMSSKDISKAKKQECVTNQNYVSTATKNRDKHTSLTITDDLSKKKHKLIQETDNLIGNEHGISITTEKKLLMKKKPKIELQETQKPKPVGQSKQRHLDINTETEDFKEKHIQTISKSSRFKEKGDLALKKQKLKDIGKEQQSKDMEDSLKKKETSYEGDNIDYNRDMKQLKSKKTETSPLKSPLKEANKTLIEETKAGEARSKHKTQADFKPGQNTKDKEKTQMKEMETKNKKEVTKNVLEKEKHDVADIKEFKRLQDEQAKNKDKELKQQKQADIELQKVKETAGKKVKEDIQAIDKLEPDQLDLNAKGKQKSKGEDKIQIKELKEKDEAKIDSKIIKLMQNKDKNDHGDLRALKRLQEEQTRNKEKESKQQKLAAIELEKIKEAANKNKEKDANSVLVAHLHRTPSISMIFSEEDLRIATENYKKDFNNKPREIIIGEQITKCKQTPILLPAGKQNITPMLFPMHLNELPLQALGTVEKIRNKSEANTDINTKKIKTEPKDKVDPESTKGIIRYSLSDRTFIDKGWTMLPTEKVVRKMNVYRMRPAHPEFDWFEHNKNKRMMHYDTGEKLADFDDKGRGRWYYKSGQIALDYYDAEETNAQQRFVVYSSGEPDERGRSYPITILATFDYLGNGIVFDHGGKIRLKYNQTEGVVLDRSIGPVSHWKWHTLNDPPVLQQVMIDTQMALKDPEIMKMSGPHDKKPRSDNEEMLAIEFDNFIKEKSKKLSQKFKPFQIKMKALKINEHFSLRVLDQATIYLIFRDGSTNVKLNIGMVLDHQEIVDTDTAEVGEVSNNLERFPARTDSLAKLQRSVAYAQRYERTRTERERRLRPTEPCASADILTAAISPPLRPAMRTVPTVSTCSTGSTKSNRRTLNNLYYNSRLL